MLKNTLLWAATSEIIRESCRKSFLFYGSSRPEMLEYSSCCEKFEKIQENIRGVVLL